MRFMKEAIAIIALLAVLILAISHHQKRLEIDKLKEQLKARECIDEIICTYKDNTIKINALPYIECFERR